MVSGYKAKTGEALSFTAFIVACLAKAVDENKYMQAYRQGRNQLILFEDVDVNTQIERDMDGHKVVMPCIIRAANTKTFRAIHQEIRLAQAPEQDLAGNSRPCSGWRSSWFPCRPLSEASIGAPSASTHGYSSEVAGRSP